MKMFGNIHLLCQSHGFLSYFLYVNWDTEQQLCRWEAFFVCAGNGGAELFATIPPPPIAEAQHNEPPAVLKDPQHS